MAKITYYKYSDQIVIKGATTQQFGAVGVDQVHVEYDGVMHDLDLPVQGNRIVIVPSDINQSDRFADGVYFIRLDANDGTEYNHFFIYTDQGTAVMTSKCPDEYSEAWAIREALKFSERYQHGTKADLELLFTRMVDFINAGPVVLEKDCNCGC